MKYLIIFLFSIQYTISQTDCFEIILENENIISVTDDNQYIWAGTSNNGLIVFDKQLNTIQNYNTANSTISGNEVTSVLQFNNKLYVSTNNSLMTFENNNFQEISTSIKGKLAKTPNGNIIIAGGFDINILTPQNELIYTKDLTTLMPQSSCCSKSTDLTYDDNETLWLSHFDFYEFDILNFNESNWNAYNESNSILPIESFSVFNGITSFSNTIMASATGKLYEFKNEVWSIVHSYSFPTLNTIQNEENNINDLTINAVEYDSEGNLWIGAGNYENSSIGKIAFKNENEWFFLNNDDIDLPGVNMFKESNSTAHILYAATNNGLILINKSCLALSTTDHEITTNFITYPNPSSGIFKLKNITEKSFSYALTDVIGREITSKVSVLEETIDLTSYSDGIYYLNLIIDNQSVVEKIIKKSH